MRSVLLAVMVVATSASVTLERWREEGKSPVQRGFELARRQGCLGCHATSDGPGVEPTDGVGAVPSFSAEDVALRARDADDLRDWILEGRPLRIPGQSAYRDHVTPEQLDALLAYIEWLRAPAAAASRRAGAVGDPGAGG